VATYVLYQGRLIEKRYLPAPPQHGRADMPAPAVHSFEAFSSPVDGHLIRSRREHDLDLLSSGSYDPRDTPAEFKRARDVRYKQRHPAEPQGNRRSSL
jgi:hypothetical protein